MLVDKPGHKMPPWAGSEPGQGQGPGSAVSPPRYPGPRSALGTGHTADLPSALREPVLPAPLPHRAALEYPRSRLPACRCRPGRNPVAVDSPGSIRWGYVLMSRLPGVPLDSVWDQLSAADRDRLAGQLASWARPSRRCTSCRHR